MAFSMDNNTPHTPQVRSLEMTGAPLDMTDAISMGFASQQETPEIGLTAFSSRGAGELRAEILVDRKRLS